MDRPRRGEFAELRQLVEKQLRGPVVDQVRARLTQWNDPAAKLERQKKRAAAVAWLFLFVSLLLAVVAAVVVVGVPGIPAGDAAEQILGGAALAIGALATGTVSARSALRVRRLNRVELPPAAPRLPAAGSLAREPMQRLADAERALADLLRQLDSPRSSVPRDSVEHARSSGVEAAAALREVAAQLEAVERARDLARQGDRSALQDGVGRLREQLDEGLDGYCGLVTAAGHLVAANSTGGPDRQALTDATDRLHGLVMALREIFPDRRG